MTRYCLNCQNPIDESARRDKQHCSRTCKQRRSLRVSDATSPADWLARALREKRRNCLKNGVLFGCVHADFEIPVKCPILGTLLAYPPNRESSPVSHYPSIDRVIPAHGYVSGNVRIISTRANMLKSAASAEEAILLAVDALKYLSGDHPWHQQPPWD